MLQEKLEATGFVGNRGKFESKTNGCLFRKISQEEVGTGIHLEKTGVNRKGFPKDQSDAWGFMVSHRDQRRSTAINSTQKNKARDKGKSRLRGGED